MHMLHTYRLLKHSMSEAAVFGQSSAANDSSSQTPSAAAAAFSPSEYSAAVIHVLQSRADFVRGSAVLEIGTGSGVVLAALGKLGAASLCGTDVEMDSVAATLSLLTAMDLGGISEVHQGDMWLPVAGRRFNLIVANLPQFPLEEPVAVLGRRATWSFGGDTGRMLLDRFIEGLDAFLLPGGHAVITHNSFIELELTRQMLQQRGLTMTVAYTFLAAVSREKFSLLPRAVVAAHLDRNLHRFGPHIFANVYVLDIARVE